ncbi:unnamed protein product [Rotaria socialis]|uniref:Uncharacterized protein n=1 Tax=Rotaria socialis TaxID=392032 RepID=A0A818AJW0_9BILA|nr:unnamed protein product [Rotaria socialis]
MNLSLSLLGISNNLINDLSSSKYMTNLDNLTSCCNQIKKLDSNMFSQANRLEWIDLSYNQIQIIDSMAFNGTMVLHLDLAGNPISSIETNFQEVKMKQIHFSIQCHQQF